MPILELLLSLLFRKTEAYQHLERSSLPPLLHKYHRQQLDPPWRDLLCLKYWSCHRDEWKYVKCK